MSKLSQERLVQAIRSASAINAIIQWTIDYTRERKAFGQTIADFQNTQFKLAELSAEAAGLRVFVDRSIEVFSTASCPASMRPRSGWWPRPSFQGCRRMPAVLGGSGYTFELPIARAFVDARVSKIAGVPSR